MSLPEIASRAEWLVARKELLAEEKDLTTRRDALKRGAPPPAHGRDREELRV